MTNKLKEMRYHRMMSATELSRRSGVNRQTIWKIETGHTKDVRYGTMVKLAKALQMPITDIFFTPSV